MRIFMHKKSHWDKILIATSYIRFRLFISPEIIFQNSTVYLFSMYIYIVQIMLWNSPIAFCI